MSGNKRLLFEHRTRRRTGALSSTETPLFVAGLTVAYDRRPVLWNVDYDSPAAGLVGIVGPNGAGKSTFLKAVLGLVPRVCGHVRVFGVESAQATSRIAYVPQRNAVDWDFPASALDVVSMGLYRQIGWMRPTRRRHREAAMACLDQVGLANIARRQIGQLSGGQRQRVFIARALAQQADIYLLDEPLAGVDAATESRIIAVLKDLQRDGRTILAVHHDLATVHDYFSHVLILNGRILADGPTREAFTGDALARAYGERLHGAVAAVDGS